MLLRKHRVELPEGVKSLRLCDKQPEQVPVPCSDERGVRSFIICLQITEENPPVPLKVRMT
ncbi:hypothetical protein ACGH2B_08335 [Streptomyces sp. BBFR2]|uniref:hypothetical protein n=1 Tax=Streptomyces sp. BBFR2 TaxID=3372854 RepID=UPI0037D9BFE2